MSDAPANRQDDLLDSLLGDFLDESDQLLTQLNERLLQLDEWVRALDDNHQESCDPSLLNEMFRAAQPERAVGHAGAHGDQPSDAQD